jgi:hypothetical protein
MDTNLNAALLFPSGERRLKAAGDPDSRASSTKSTKTTLQVLNYVGSALTQGVTTGYCVTTTEHTHNNFEYTHIIDPNKHSLLAVFV